MSYQNKVEEFHRVFGLPINEKNPSEALLNLREDLIKEEVQELFEARTDSGIDLVEAADALGDIVYLCYGYAVVLGIDLDKVLNEVHRSNMSKLENGKVIYREDGKVLKGSNFSPPDLSFVLAA